MPLSGKTVLVTGASAGIGRATAIALAQAGAKILATGRRRTQLDALKQQCGSAVETIAGDLNDGRFVDELASAARDVDLFVNNAGVLKYAPLLDMTDADCETMFRTNVLASFRITHRVAKSMVERRRGHIIVMTSIAAREVYRRDLLRDQTRAVGVCARPAHRAAGPWHQGHRDRARDGRYRDPRRQHSPERAGGAGCQKVRGSHLGRSGGSSRVCGAGRAQLLSRSHRAAAARVGLTSFC